VTLIGLPLWYGTVSKHKSIEEILALAKSKGIEYFEISIDYPWPYRKRDLLDSIVVNLTNLGFRIAVHAPWRDIHLASTYEDIRRASVKEVIRSIKDYSEKAEYIVIHASTAQKLTINNIRREILGALKKSIDEILESLGENTYICIENLSSGFPSEMQDIVDAVINTTNCLVLDVAHAYVTFIKHYKHHYNDFIEYLDDLIKMFKGIEIPVVHYHDVHFSNGFREHIIPCDDITKHKELLKRLRTIMPRFFLIEAFIDKNGRHLDITELINRCRELMTWIKIYL